jgi:hypothetical protein
VRVKFPHATHLVITVSGHHTKSGWAERALQRLREQLAPLKVELNLEKTKIVDTMKDESFGFLGFDLRRVRKREGDGYFIHMIPKKKARTAIKAKIREIIQRGGSASAIRSRCILRSHAAGYGFCVAQRCSFAQGCRRRPGVGLRRAVLGRTLSRQRMGALSLRGVDGRVRGDRREVPAFSVATLAGRPRFADSPLYVVMDWAYRKLAIIPCWEIFREYYV